ncbi:MAG: hypothetical protein EPO39_12900 [Candidatus Manganitrophaceae bacterium]|nr:MAG: hypothetical protein EPO39_12900 [Candidatus Manganitrophaceae bacterium]
MKSVPVSLKEGSLQGVVNADYHEDRFLSFLSDLPEAIKENRHPLLDEREDRLYLSIEATYGGSKKPLFVKVDDFTRRVRLKKWFRNFFVPSRARKSWRAGEILIRHGLPTPMPIAFLETKRWGFLLRSYLLVEQLPAAEAVHRRYQRLYRQSADAGLVKEKGVLLEALAAALATLHQNGVFYGDLKASNVLAYPTQGGMGLAFVDLESVRISRSVSLSRRVEDLGSLLCSFLGIVSRRDAFRFIKIYMAASPTLSADRKEFIGKINRFAIQRKGGAQPPPEGRGSGSV